METRTYAIRCYCGGSYTKSNVSHHKKTSKHLYHNRPAERLLRDYYQLTKQQQKLFKMRIMGLYQSDSDSDSDSEIII